MANNATQANSFTLDMSKFKFAPLEKHVLYQGSRAYHTQALTYDNTDCIITTPWFKSNGLSCSSQFEKAKPEILVKYTEEIKKLIHEIESVAINNLEIPNNLSIPFGKTRDTLFKRIPDVNNIFVKLAPECTYYGKNFETINKQHLAHGNYRVALHVVGTYVGSHGQTDKIASLSMRITQILFEPINIPCLFQNVGTNVFKVLNLDDISSVNVCTAAITEKPPKVVRKPRRPKLQRQNGVEFDAEAQHMENIYSNDLFADL